MLGMPYRSEGLVRPFTALSFISFVALVVVTVAAARPIWVFLSRFVAPAAPLGTIDVIDATYGGNCGASRGNAASWAREQCNGRDSCKLVVDFKKLGDPANGCGKDLVATWSCGRSGDLKSVLIPGEALGSVAWLTCLGDASGETTK